MANPNPIPPEEHKFKPGQSGNPNGRPKGARSLSTILREMLEEEIDVNIDGVNSRKQFQEVIIRKLLKKANDGDIRAIMEVFDRVEGKTSQMINQNTHHSGGISITWQDPDLPTGQGQSPA